MIKLSNIKHRLTSPKGQKISLTILIVGIFFFAPTFAAVESETGTSKILLNAQYLIQNFLEILSRSWILLASLAWKFMTNDMVYGSWLHLDAYLWKLRNICKNFANFGLLAILLRQIIQYVSKKTGNIQSIVTKSVIAGILIQASWFLMAILLDISTIATAAISSFPTHFIDSSALSKETIEKEIAGSIKNHKIILDKEWKTFIDKSDNQQPITSIDEWIEKIMPKNDSVAGPLVYIWASTLKIQNALNHPENQDPNVKKIVTTSVLQFLAIAIYCITLILLLVTNIIRVWLLRVIIPLSPILVLMFTLWKEGKEGIAKNFNIGVILNAIFKPVIFAGVLSLVLIFIVSMQNIMNNPNNQSFTIQWTTFGVESWAATMEVNWLSKTTINDTVFTQIGNTGKNIFSNIIIYFATIFLLRYLVKIAAKSGGWTIWDTMTNLTKRIEDTAKLAPIFPVGGWVWWDALKQSWENLKQGIAQWFDMDVDWNWRKTENKEFNKKISGIFWILPNWDQYDYNKITRSINNSNNPNDFFTTTKEIIQESGGRQWWLNFNNSRRQDLFKKRLEKYPDKDKNKIGNYTNGEDLDKFLEDKTDWWDYHRKILHNVLIEGGTKSNKTPGSYQEFKTTIYWETEKKD